MRILFILILVALLGVSLYFNVDQHRQNKASEKRVETLAKKQQGIIKIYKAADSTIHYKYRDRYAESPAEKALAISPDYVDSLKKALNIKDKALLEASRIKFTVKETVKSNVDTDSAGNKTISYQGKWLSFNANSKDSLTTYAYIGELKNSRYHKGPFFNRQTYNDISFADPSASITGMDFFRVPPERIKRFGIGGHIGYDYIPELGKFYPAIGVGISYNLIQF